MRGGKSRRFLCGVCRKNPCKCSQCVVSYVLSGGYQKVYLLTFVGVWLWLAGLGDARGRWAGPRQPGVRTCSRTAPAQHRGGFPSPFLGVSRASPSLAGPYNRSKPAALPAGVRRHSWLFYRGV